jgi:hypothetical protein
VWPNDRVAALMDCAIGQRSNASHGETGLPPEDGPQVLLSGDLGVTGRDLGVPWACQRDGRRPMPADAPPVIDEFQMMQPRGRADEPAARR